MNDYKELPSEIALKEAVEILRSSLEVHPSKEYDGVDISTGDASCRVVIIRTKKD